MRLIGMRGLLQITYLGIFLFATVLSGCVKLQRQFPDVRFYTLTVTSDSAHLPFRGHPVSVKINAFSSVPTYADRYLTYRTGETTYEQDFYNQFLASPARVIEDQASLWMKRSLAVSFVSTRLDEEMDTDYSLDGALQNISGDYRDERNAKAVLRILLTVHRKTLKDSTVALQKIYSSEVPMSQPSPKNLTKGWNTGLEQILKEFEKDFQEAVIKS